MKYFSFLLFVAICSFSGAKNAEDVLKDMHKRYAGKWYKSFTFTQTTEQYKNDSLTKTSTWYEYIIFPDKFRIDFGDKKEGNSVLYVKDSVYNFRKNKLIYKGYDNDNLTFLLGGMYSYSFDSVKAKIKRQGYDLGRFHENTWNGQPVYVIGANEVSEKSNQLWIDKDKLIVLKFIKFKGKNKEEGIFSEHKRFGNAWSETAVDFYVNDKLIQKEKYYDCKADVEIDPALFDPASFSVDK